MAVKARLHAMIASHMDSPERLTNFKYLVEEGVLKQLEPPSSLIIAATCEDKALCDDFGAFITSLSDRLAAQNMVGLYSLRYGQRASVMENYKHALLASEYASDIADEDWLVFSGDDDIWHAARTACYWISLLVHDGRDIPMRLPPTAETDTATGATRDVHYTEVAVKAGVFRSFLRQAPEADLKHYYAERYWMRCLEQAFPSITLVPIPNPVAWT